MSGTGQHDTRIDGYVQAVLARVPLREAHAEIAAELEDHIACTREDDPQTSVDEALTRLGSTDVVGERFAAIHRPRSDLWLAICATALLLAGIGLLALVVGADLSPTAGSDKLVAHIVFAALGVGLAAVLWRGDYRQLRRVGVWLAPLTGLALLAAWTFGPTFGGRPYLALGSLRLDVVGISPVFFVIALTSLPRSDRVPRDILRLAAVMLPVVILPLLGGRLEAAFFLLAALVVLARDRGARLPLALCAVLGPLALVLLAGPVSLSLRAGRAYAESDYLVGIALGQLGRWALAVLIVIALGMLLRVSALATRAVDPFGRALAAGLGTLLAAAFTWSLLANAGVILLPTTGLVFPLCGYGGSALVTHLAALGLLLGVSRLQSVSSHAP